MKKRKVMTGVLLGCVLLCAACGKKTTESDMDKSEVPLEEVTALSETTPAPSVEATQVPTLTAAAALTPTVTPEVTPTPTLMPTLTPTPTPTITPEPTATPTATPEPTTIVEMDMEDKWYTGEVFRLENDTFIDLDSDGVAEHLVYSGGRGARVFINGEAMSVGTESYPMYEDHDCFEEYAEVVSLDGETLQLVLLDYGEGHSFFIRIYQYEQGSWEMLGYLPALSYEVQEIDGKRRLVTYGEEFLLENCIVEFHYEYVDGEIKELPREFYEYMSTWVEEEAVTVLQEFTLYADKKGTLGVTLSVGSKVEIVGSDLKEWVLIRNVETGEEGWLQLNEMHDCILPDGRILEEMELFEGLIMYG